MSCLSLNVFLSLLTTILHNTFRIGLFGLDKLKNIDETVESLSTAIKQVFAN